VISGKVGAERGGIALIGGYSFSDKLEDGHVHVIVGLVRVSGPQLIRHLVLHLVAADVTYYNAGFVADGLL
jgi:hypothetical protein